MIYDLRNKLAELLPAACGDIAEILNDVVTFELNTYGSFNDTIRATLYIGDTKQWLGSFALSPFPGNSAVVVSSDVELSNGYRGFGVGRLLHSMRLKAMKEAGAWSALCTVGSGNEAEIAIVEKNGWTKVFSVSPTASLYSILFF